MKNTEPRVRLIALTVAVGINQLIDKGYSENIDIIADKIFKGELVEYITTKYKDEDIKEFSFSEISKNNLPEFNKLLSDYEPLASSSYKYYGIQNNGLVLASSVLSNILYEEK